MPDWPVCDPAITAALTIVIDPNPKRLKSDELTTRSATGADSLITTSVSSDNVNPANITCPARAVPERLMSQLATTFEPTTAAAWAGTRYSAAPSNAQAVEVLKADHHVGEGVRHRDECNPGEQ